MMNLDDPYIIRYPEIVGVADETGDNVELIEFFDCIGGAMWSRLHYAKSPVVRSVRNVGSSMRYLLTPGNAELDLKGSTFPAGIRGVVLDDHQIAISYEGLGGGGVGAASCRSYAGGVLKCQSDPAGGGRKAGATIWIPRRQRVLIGVDDTDTPQEGATWTLAHNIARAVQDESSRYLSHTIVQLFPVQFRTKNCVSIVCEFATGDPAGLIGRFRSLLEQYTLSSETGMAAYTGFDPMELLDYAWKVKRGQVDPGLVGTLRARGLELVLEGRGIVGAVAAIPFYTRYEEALLLCDGKT
ncbi:MAG TPA: methanogenesis marker protein 11 [Methanoregulaceae archaeon]|nr:methanogenesis marker protein 11 [Methanoregulaceae archaeon]